MTEREDNCKLKSNEIGGVKAQGLNTSIVVQLQMVKKKNFW